MIKKRIIRVIIVLIFLCLFVYSYFVLIMKTDFNDFIIYTLDNKYNIEKYNNIFYKSINKLVKSNKEITYNEEVIDNNDEVIGNPIIYIYNTHDTEKYSLDGEYDYSIRPSVKIASYILKDHLNDLGISSYIQKRNIKDYLDKHNLNYNGSYTASRAYIKEDKNKGDFKIYIDIHRDSALYDKTLFKKDNKKYARFLFVVGKKNKDYKKNLEIVNYLNNKLNKDYKGLSRGIIYKESSIFNQDLSPRSILLEVGGVDNTLEEINNSLYVFSGILNDYINEELNG